MANAGIDENSRQSLTAISNVDGTTIVRLWADPVTHRLLVDLPGGAGTVTSVSVVSANGFAGTVADATTTPAITLTTTITGILQGNGTAISAASTTGSGAVVLATSPTLVTPNLGTPSTLVGTNITGTAAGLSIGGNAATATTATTTTNATVANEATDTSCFLTFVTAATGDLPLKTNANLPFNSNTGVLTLTAPVLGTPTSGTLTNCTGLPISSGVSGLGANVATFLGTPSSANLLAALTDETGTGLAVFNNSPTFLDDITVGTASTATGQILFKGTTSGTVTLSVADAAGTWTMKLPTTDGDSGQFLQTDGSGNTSWAAASGGSTILNYTSSPVAVSTGIGTTPMNTNTTMFVAMMNLPAAITVNSLEIETTAVGTAGTLDLTVYSEDGSSKPIAVTTASISGAAVITTAVAAVTLPAGNYYFAMNTNGTADVTVRNRTLQNISLLNTTGEAVMGGTLTITAGTPPATIDPTAITVGVIAPLFRLNN